MIEVNKKAKPFHPCESLLGAELFFKFRKCSLFGRNYYDPTHPTPNKDILTVVKPSQSLNNTLKAIEKEGYKHQTSIPALNHYYQYEKQHEGGTIRLFLAPNRVMYMDLMEAQEVCKYLQSLTPNTPLDKLLVVELHQVIMQGKTVDLGDGGYFQALLDNQEEDVPVGGGLAGGNHIWAGAPPIVFGDWNPAFHVQEGQNVNPAQPAAQMEMAQQAPQDAADNNGPLMGMIQAFMGNVGGNNNNA